MLCEGGGVKWPDGVREGRRECKSPSPCLPSPTLSSKGRDDIRERERDTRGDLRYDKTVYLRGDGMRGDEREREIPRLHDFFRE